MAAGSATGLIERLARGPASAAELTQALGISQPTLSRLLRPLERAGRVVRIGSTRGARYGLAREVGTVGSRWPLYAIDESGRPTEVGVLHAIERERYVVRGGPPRIAGQSEGLPYFLQDARPAGFLGRAIPAAHPDLGLPLRVADWTDAHALTYLTQRGSDNVGNLIVGLAALDHYLRGEHGPQLVRLRERARRYPALAASAMAGAPPGSLAQGEHPKFAAQLVDARRQYHVLVKFSPPRTTPSGERWGDLLVAEHLASELLLESGIAAARTALLVCNDQVFLQSERFDRVGADGRCGVATLYSVDLNYYGRLDSWTRSAARLQADRLLSPADAESITLLDLFGALIANSDRHFGNVTLFDRYEGPFQLAPVYDMLPMLFAPQDAQIVPRTFEPPSPTAATLDVWQRARALAERYWARLCDEPRLSAGFRGIAAECLDAVRAIPQRRGLRALAR